MRSKRWLLLMVGSFLLAAFSVGFIWYADAQPGGKKKGDKKGGFGFNRTPETEASFLSKLMVFDKDKNGNLSKEELTDTRLHSLFDRADSNKDGTVTREELQTLFTRESSTAGKGDFGFPKGEKGKGFDGKKGPPPGKEKGNPQNS